jgi:hypothetical protein
MALLGVQKVPVTEGGGGGGGFGRGGGPVGSPGGFGILAINICSPEAGPNRASCEPIDGAAVASHGASLFPIFCSEAGAS